MLNEVKLTKKEKEALLSLGIVDSQAVFTHYPFRYEEIVNRPYIEWEKGEKVALEGILISQPKTSRFKKIVITKFLLETEVNQFEITIFNRPWFKNFSTGSNMTIFGKYEGKQKITAFQFNKIPLSEQLGIHPVYHLKEGIDQKRYRKLVEETFVLHKEEIVNQVPESLRKSYRLLKNQDAYRMIHFPKSMDEVKLSRRTLKYEEFLLFQLTIQLRKKFASQDAFGIAKTFDFDEVFGLANRLSFSLTMDQVKTVNDILEDLSSEKVMYRLVQGDVGCGKTLVAILGLYACVLSGKQGAFMAPTEILAKQHYASLKSFLKPTKLKIACLYSSLSNIEKKEILEELKNGTIDILVGTHALIQDSVIFYDLGMVVTDEQHRFGVEQRKKLKEKGNKVDFLMMSATPIPRTLANIIYGDMDVSTILTLPSGRKPIITKLILENSMRSILDEVLISIEHGNRCYVVCPMIELDETSTVRNVTKIHEELTKEIQKIRNKPFKVGLLHGKMTSEDKEAVMKSFETGKTQFLVSTTVIEVGVNVKEANNMVIYDANRFGLSQLHQLRGRVGRGQEQGYCYLLTSSKEEETLARLKVIEDTTDGFEIARQDLYLRGPGDVLGTKQSGLPNFILGDIVQDQAIMDAAKKDAIRIIESKDVEFNDILQFARTAIEENHYID